jgi:hypothetical protein
MITDYTVSIFGYPNYGNNLRPTIYFTSITDLSNKTSTHSRQGAKDHSNLPTKVTLPVLALRLTKQFNTPTGYCKWGNEMQF